MKKLLPFLLLPLLALVACEEGNPLDNQPPDTRIFLDGIDLTGDARLNSVVRLHWSGEDRDGYIKGYELSMDNSAWTFVTQQDSVFRFPLNPGSDSNDIDFWVRAIDNLDAADESPAYLSIPIKNAPPVATIDSVKLIPDTVFTVFSALWEVSDLDGNETIDSVFIKLNDGAWYALQPSASFITIVPENPKQAGSQMSRVYVGSNARAENSMIEGLRLEGNNQLMIRASDIAGTVSDTDSSKSFYVKAQQSDLLVIDDHSDVAADNVLLPLLNDVTQNDFDYFRLAANIPPFWDPTFGKFLELYDRVFWYSDGAEQSSFGAQLFLEIASNQIQLYLNQEENCLLALPFQPVFRPRTQRNITHFRFLSHGQSFIQQWTAPNRHRQPAESSRIVQWLPSLTSSSFIIGADPFTPKTLPISCIPQT
ncbi:MAG: hypothetical protein R3B47_01780 [Bacteroidia bacterium]